MPIDRRKMLAGASLAGADWAFRDVQIDSPLSLACLYRHRGK